MKGFTDFLTEISQRLLGEKCQVNNLEKDSLKDRDYLQNADLVEKARQDWTAAISLFNNISDQELVDHAIFNLNAAERRYVYLLKEARRENELKKSILREGGNLKEEYD